MKLLVEIKSEIEIEIEYVNHHEHEVFNFNLSKANFSINHRQIPAKSAAHILITRKLKLLDHSKAAHKLERLTEIFRRPTHK